ncbi:MAG: type II toxin-antitoxin system VapC family toxin [Acidobacteriota bacterium]
MKKVFVDTGAWYALVDGRDPDHKSIVQALRRDRGLLLTSNYVFDEAITLLRYRCSHRSAQRLGEALRGGALAQIVRVSTGDEEQAWTTFVRYGDKTLSFTDCTSFAVMRRLKLRKVIGLDRDFRRMGFQQFPNHSS